METHYYLVHHGILGQRWGKRNGPPYPLDQQDKSATEKRKEKDGLTNKQKNDTINSKEKRKFHLTDKQKTAIKVGAIAAGAALAAIGGYQLYKSGKLDELINLGKTTISNSGAQKGASLDQSTLDEISSKTGLRQTGLNLSPTQASTIMGTERREAIREARPGEAMGWKNNCGHASMAYIFSRMGFDVTPNPVDFLNGHEDVQWGTEFSDIFDIFKNPHETVSQAHSSSELAQDILKSYGNVDGSYGIIGASSSKNGHFFVWENVKGNIEFHNPQDERLANQLTSALSSTFSTYRVTRLDGCELNSNYRNQGDPNLVYERLKTIMTNA